MPNGFRPTINPFSLFQNVSASLALEPSVTVAYTWTGRVDFKPAPTAAGEIGRCSRLPLHFVVGEPMRTITAG